MGRSQRQNTEARHAAIARDITVAILGQISDMNASWVLTTGNGTKLGKAAGDIFSAVLEAVQKAK